MLKQGIYEHIINQETDRKMQEAKQSGLVCVQQPIDSAESPQMLANYLANAIRQKLEDTEEQQDRVNLINRIMIDAGLLDDKQIVKPADLLAEVMTQQQSALQNQSNTQTIRPISGFRVSNLFTGGSSALSLGEEIQQMHLGRLFPTVTYAAGISVKLGKVSIIDIRYADQFRGSWAESLDKRENQWIWTLDTAKQPAAQTFRTSCRSVQVKYGVVF